MSKITITQGKLLKKDKVEVEYLKQNSADAKPAKCSEEHVEIPHEDLKKSFEKLAIHAALVGEFIPAKNDLDIEDPELAKDFYVTGFTLSDEGDTVILSARKILKTKKTMGFNTPSIKLTEIDPDKELEYIFAEQLAESLDECKDELTQYLRGKFAPDPQGVLFPEKETGKVEEKKRGRKKNPELV